MTGVLVTVGATVLIAKLRARYGSNLATIGWMSEQWLSEWRASNQT